MKVYIAIDNSESSSAAVNAVADGSWPAATTLGKRIYLLQAKHDL
jgi:hypothetical protein